MEIKDYLIYFYDLPKIRGNLFEELSHYREDLLEYILRQPSNRGYAFLRNAIKPCKGCFSPQRTYPYSQWG